MTKTEIQYKEVISKCRALFEGKNKDYGQSWRMFRPSSIADQIYIKALRIRTLEEKGKSLVGEGQLEEFQGIVNYAIMAMMQLEWGAEGNEVAHKELIPAYDRLWTEAFELMSKKNHDYGEAWRDMRVSTFTDMILVRIHRIRQIEDNGGATSMSEGIASNYQDILNYAIFALIRLTEK